jgi:hypothetical protein
MQRTSTQHQCTWIFGYRGSDHSPKNRANDQNWQDLNSKKYKAVSLVLISRLLAVLIACVPDEQVDKYHSRRLFQGFIV